MSAFYTQNATLVNTLGRLSLAQLGTIQTEDGLSYNFSITQCERPFLKLIFFKPVPSRKSASITREASTV